MTHKTDIQKTKKVRIFKNLKSHWLNAKGQNHVQKDFVKNAHLQLKNVNFPRKRTILTMKIPNISENEVCQ